MNFTASLKWYQLKNRLEPEVVSLGGHKFPVQFIAFSPDSLQVAWRANDFSAVLWNMSSGRHIAKKSNFRGLALSPDTDSPLLAGASGIEIELLDAKTGQSNWPHCGGTSGSSETLFFPGRQAARLGQRGHNCQTLGYHDAKATRFAAGSSRHWPQLAFSPDGKWLASTGNDCSVIVWDVSTHAEVQRLKGHSTAITHIAWSVDSKRLASAAKDPEPADKEFVVKLWNVDTGKIAHLARHTKHVTHLAFSPDGRQLATSSDDRTIELWDATTGREIFCLKGHTRAVDHCCFSPDSASLASAGNDTTVRIWDSRSGAQIGMPLVHEAGVKCVAFSPNGRWLASAGDDGAVKLTDLRCVKEVAKLAGHEREIRHVAYSADGKRLASAGADKTVRIWDALTGKQLAELKGHATTVTCVQFSHDDSQIASASGDRTIRLWNALTYQSSPPMKAKDQVVHLAFQP